MSLLTRLKPGLDFALTRLPRAYAALLAARGASDSDRRIFLEILRPGDVVFDVGSNRGFYTLLFSHLVRSSGAVHAFEPVQCTFDSLAPMLREHAHYANVVLNRTAVGDVSGPRTIYRPAGDPAQASLRRHDLGSWASTDEILEEACDALTLDQYIDAARIERLDLLKADVEGAELPLLLGADDTLRRFRPILHIEVCARWQKDFAYSPLDLRRTLLGLGYSAFVELSDTGPGRTWGDPFERLASVAQDDSLNVLCLMPDRHLERLPARLRRTFRP